MRGSSSGAMPCPVSSTTEFDAVAPHLGSDVHFAAGGRVLDGVADQVGDDLHQPVAVPGDLRHGRRVDLQRDAFLLRDDGEPLRRPPR